MISKKVLFRVSGDSAVSVWFEVGSLVRSLLEFGVEVVDVDFYDGVVQLRYEGEDGFIRFLSATVAEVVLPFSLWHVPVVERSSVSGGVEFSHEFSFYGVDGVELAFRLFGMDFVGFGLVLDLGHWRVLFLFDGLRVLVGSDELYLRFDDYVVALRFLERVFLGGG